MKKELREIVWHKYGGRCAYCGIKIEYKQMQVDHIVSQENFKFYVLNKFEVPEFLTHLTVDDVGHIDNLNPACRPCNLDKNAGSLDKWRLSLKHKITCLRRISNFRHMEKYGLVEVIDKPIVFYFETIAAKDGGVKFD